MLSRFSNIPLYVKGKNSSVLMRWINLETGIQGEERKKNIVYSAYMWNLEERCYLQGRNRDADVENRLVDTAGRRGWDRLRE